RSDLMFGSAAVRSASGPKLNTASRCRSYTGVFLGRRRIAWIEVDPHCRRASFARTSCHEGPARTNRRSVTIGSFGATGGLPGSPGRIPARSSAPGRTHPVAVNRLATARGSAALPRPLLQLRGSTVPDLQQLLRFGVEPAQLVVVRLVLFH